MNTNSDFSSEFFYTFFEDSPEAIVIIDKNEIVLSNKQTLVLFGYSGLEEFIGKKIEDISPEYQYDMNSSAEKAMERINYCLSGHNPVFEWIHKKKNNDLFYCEIKLNKIFFNSKEFICASIRDISPRKELEEQLRNAKEKAEEATRLKSKFLSNMSHEIRTPLNAIIGFSELLSESDVDEEDRKYFSNLIKNNGDLLLNLINDILDIAKIEADELKIVNSRCPVNTLLKEIYLNFKKEMQDKKEVRLELITALANPNFAIECDPYRLHQIVANLLNNAKKFTFQGKIEFGYEILNDKFLRFFVKDTGIGIDPEQQTHIFNRFKQANNLIARNFGGTGLGLDISKRLVELMGGEIWFHSESNIGTQFYFTIPFLEIADQKSNATKTEKEIFDWSAKTILIAEDIDVNYDYLEYLLRRTKVNLLHAMDGEMAVKLFKENESHSPIDLILMDIQMPKMDGFQAMKEIKKMKKELPIIAQTAFAMDHEEQKCLNEGFDDFLSKPIKQEILYTKIQQYFQ